MSKNIENDTNISYNLIELHLIQILGLQYLTLRDGTMKKISYQKLQAGMVLAKPLYFFEDYFLLNEGVIVTPNFVEQIKRRQIKEIFILEEQEGPVISDLPFSEKIPDNIEKKLYLQTYLVYQKLAENILKGKDIDLHPTRQCIEELTGQIVEEPDKFLQLTLLKAADTYTSVHSINVAIFSVLLGHYMGWERPRLIELGIGALLHDIGKLKIPFDILHKPGLLDSEELKIIQNHSLLGVEALSRTANVSEQVINIIKDHHERGDGSGYPHGLHADLISEEAKLVAIADIYDALTTDRTYRRALLPHQAAEILIAYSYKNQLDVELVKQFTRNIAIYPLACIIELSDNTVVRVINKNQNFPLRPQVETTSPSGKVGQIIDLAREPQLSIVGLIKSLNCLNDDSLLIPLEKLIWKVINGLLDRGELNCCQLGQCKIVALAIHQLQNEGKYPAVDQPMNTIASIQQDADILQAVYQAVAVVKLIEKH